MLREPVPLHQKGWHPTAMRGTIAAAAACARLRRLDADKTAAALGLSASMAGGIIANFGTMTKSFHVGRAAQSGLIAAQLAEAGMTAATDALEHRSGFLMAISPENRLDLSLPFDEKDRPWQITKRGLSIKRYPVCYGAHRVIDGMLDLIRKNDLGPDDVTHVHVVIGEHQALMLRNAKPQTGLEAKFSMQFAIASALNARNVGLSQLVDDFVRKPEIQAVFPRVSVETNTGTLEGSSMGLADSVELTTRAGGKLSSGAIRYAKGSFQLPVSRDELKLKFDDCLGDISATRKLRIFENLMALDRLAGASDLSLLAQ
jgi:2-methylcitrate dehydratase PrpD